MNKREALIKALTCAARAIDEYTDDGRLNNYLEWQSGNDQGKVEVEMYGIASSLRLRAEKLEGDDGGD